LIWIEEERRWEERREKRENGNRGDWNLILTLGCVEQEMRIVYFRNFYILLHTSYIIFSLLSSSLFFSLLLSSLFSPPVFSLLSSLFSLFSSMKTE